MNSQQLQGEVHNNNSERTISLILLILIIAVGIYFFIPLPFFKSAENMRNYSHGNSYEGSRDLDENSKRVLDNDFYATETNIDSDYDADTNIDVGNILSGVQDIRHNTEESD